MKEFGDFIIKLVITVGIFGLWLLAAYLMWHLDINGLGIIYLPITVLSFFWGWTIYDSINK
jgi:hypothetical protein